MVDNLWCEGLSFDDWSDKYDEDEEVNKYLYGYCHQWVINHYQEGDKCVALLESREGFNTMCLMHACLIRDGKYLDIRGATSHLYDILEAFDWGDYEVVECDDLDSFKDILKGINIEYEEASEDIEK
jgi:hypothetical protein